MAGKSIETVSDEVLMTQLERTLRMQQECLDYKKADIGVLHGLVDACIEIGMIQAELERNVFDGASRAATGPTGRCSSVTKAGAGSQCKNFQDRAKVFLDTQGRESYSGPPPATYRTTKTVLTGFDTGPLGKPTASRGETLPGHRRKENKVRKIR